MTLKFMRSRITGVSLGAVLLFAAAAAQAADHVATEAGEIELRAAPLLKVSSASSLRVHRGGHSETLRFDPTPGTPFPETAVPETAVPGAAGSEAAGPEVVVHRGTTAPEVPQAVPVAAPQAQFRVSSGRELWLYDPGGETVRACRLFKSSRAGRFKIRCFERRLH